MHLFKFVGNRDNYVSFAYDVFSHSATRFRIPKECIKVRKGDKNVYGCPNFCLVLSRKIISHQITLRSVFYSSFEKDYESNKLNSFTGISDLFHKVIEETTKDSDDIINTIEISLSVACELIIFLFEKNSPLYVEDLAIYWFDVYFRHVRSEFESMGGLAHLHTSISSGSCERGKMDAFHDKFILDNCLSYIASLKSQSDLRNLYHESLKEFSPKANFQEKLIKLRITFNRDSLCLRYDAEHETEASIPASTSNCDEVSASALPLVEAKETQSQGVPVVETEETQSQGVPLVETEETQSQGVPLVETEETQSQGVPLVETKETPPQSVPVVRAEKTRSCVKPGTRVKQSLSKSTYGDRSLKASSPNLSPSMSWNSSTKIDSSARGVKTSGQKFSVSGGLKTKSQSPSDARDDKTPSRGRPVATGEKLFRQSNLDSLTMKQTSDQSPVNKRPKGGSPQISNTRPKGGSPQISNTRPEGRSPQSSNIKSKETANLKHSGAPPQQPPRRDEGSSQQEKRGKDSVSRVE